VINQWFFCVSGGGGERESEEARANEERAKEKAGRPAPSDDADDADGRRRPCLIHRFARASERDPSPPPLSRMMALVMTMMVNVMNKM
jgi:hypothetical protein